MVSQSTRTNSDQQVLELFDLASHREGKKRRSPAQRKQRLMKHKLNEVVFGHRPALKVYSKALQTDLWFINEGLVDPSDEAFQGRAITMDMLAQIMSSTGHLVREIEELLDQSIASS